MIPVLQVMITYGEAGSKCSPWPKSQKHLLSELMAKLWLDLALWLRRHGNYKDTDVAELLCSEEA